MKTISILTPARRRPNNMLRMIDSIKESISGNHNIEVIFRVDDTDELLLNEEFKINLYQKISIRVYINMIVGPETFPDLGCLWNECFDKCNGDIVQMGGDDLVYVTKGWDEILVNKSNFEDEIYLSWGPDGTFNTRLATHGFVSRKWVEAVGWITPPLGLTYANDDFIHSVAHKIGRLNYLCDMEIKHLWDGGNPNDPNYGRMGELLDRSHEIRHSREGVAQQSWAVDQLVKVMK